MNERNKQIAEIFKEAGLIEKYGSGIGRIVNMFKRHGLKKPAFKECQDGFMVVVYGSTQKPTQEPTQKPTQKTALQTTIIKALKRNPYITRKALAKALDVSENTLKENLAKLKKTKIIIRFGPDRGGHWDILGE